MKAPLPRIITLDAALSDSVQWQPELKSGADGMYAIAGKAGSLSPPGWGGLGAQPPVSKGGRVGTKDLCGPGTIPVGEDLSKSETVTGDQQPLMPKNARANISPCSQATTYPAAPRPHPPKPPSHSCSDRIVRRPFVPQNRPKPLPTVPQPTYERAQNGTL